ARANRFDNSCSGRHLFDPREPLWLQLLGRNKTPDVSAQLSIFEHFPKQQKTSEKLEACEKIGWFPPHQTRRIEQYQLKLQQKRPRAPWVFYGFPVGTRLQLLSLP